MTTTARTDAWTTGGAPAANYQRELVPVLFAPWARDLVAEAGLNPGDRILDLACGTGIIARTATRSVDLNAVTGIDVNADMLAVARAESVSARPPITWLRADAADTGLPDASIDVAFCQQGLQFFPDRHAALTELRRVVAPGGRIVISAWAGPNSPGYAGFAPRSATTSRTCRKRSTSSARSSASPTPPNCTTCWSPPGSTTSGSPTNPAWCDAPRSPTG